LHVRKPVDLEVLVKMSRLLIFASLALCMTLAVSALAEPPSNGFIGVFGDAAGTDCCVSLNSSGNGKFHVIMVTGGASAEGISGAEFKVSVEPAAPGATFNWKPSNIVSASSGDPIDNGSGGGVFVTFDACQTQTGLAGDKINMGTLQVNGLTGEHQLVVRRTDNPINPEFTCASVLLCDAPAFTQVCLTLKEGDPALNGEEPAAFVTAVNSPDCAGASCGFVATEDQTWTTVKALFR
jgi:hypothetical protein